MTHYSDLTPYSYGAADSSATVARNIGWLGAGVDFPVTSNTDPQFLHRLWRFCRISIGQTRGLHECDLCRSRQANIARQNGEELLLGSAEIRVLSDKGQLYAAPNLIYHYVSSHKYSPPPEFVLAVMAGLCPPEEGYYGLLSRLGISWSKTLVPDQRATPFRFVQTPEGVFKVEE